MIDTEALIHALGELDGDQFESLLDDFIATNPTPEEAQQVVDSCQQGMEIVGDYFDDGTYFVGDLMYAARMLMDTLEKLRPIIAEEGEVPCSGTMVLGTVEGDIHDIGKNIFKMLMEVAGFNVIDLGVDQSPQAFIAAVKENNAELLGLSGVLTLSLESMRRTVEELKEAGLRDKVKVMIGGSAVSEEGCKYAGADYWSKNAAASVKQSRLYMGSN
jgi:methylmalonyl-CoA mutase cobalamin-binding domain/chain